MWYEKVFYSKSVCSGHEAFFYIPIRMHIRTMQCSQHHIAPVLPVARQTSHPLLGQTARERQLPGDPITYGVTFDRVMMRGLPPSPRFTCWPQRLWALQCSLGCAMCGGKRETSTAAGPLMGGGMCSLESVHWVPQWRGKHWQDNSKYWEDERNISTSLKEGKPRV